MRLCGSRGATALTTEKNSADAKYANNKHCKNDLPRKIRELRLEASFQLVAAAPAFLRCRPTSSPSGVSGITVESLALQLIMVVDIRRDLMQVVRHVVFVMLEEAMFRAAAFCERFTTPRLLVV